MPTVSPKIELLQAEVDEETESYFRLLIDEKTVKYITIAAGVYNTDDMCFGPQLVQILPQFPPGDWNTGHVDKRTQDNERIFTRTERLDYPSIQKTWHAVGWDHLDLTFGRYLRTEPLQSLHASTGRSQRMIAKRPSTNGLKDET
ncbi:hypothetical protein D0865_03788 [Hortaea werneckii]|uniref:Uncharacterized protein n=1 Tax=Hortaea werneckii TaxID=91943 RepID=A0A3M7CW13_HORWE|nr:hypothetical protein D0865_03788 [Hortaea werneckii]